MKIENKDQNIRDEINNLEDLPNDINWTTEMGWEHYKKKYTYRNKKRIIHWILAAAAILFFGLVWMFNELHYSNKNNLFELRSNNIKKEEIVLKDGSKIWLNYNSSLIIDQKKNKIAIEGEAYFELSTKNKYAISSPHGKYITKASVFNLSTREKEAGAMLTVSKGEVNIIWESDITQNSIVEAGIQAKIIPKVAIVKIPIFDTNYLSWKTEELHFDNTPLYCVIDKLKELNNSDIEVIDNNIRYCRISSDFNTVSTKEVLQKMTKYLNYTIEYTGKKFIIKGDGCNM